MYNENNHYHDAFKQTETPPHTYYGRPVYSAPQPEPPRPKKKRKRGSPVALLVLVALIAGAAGGGAGWLAASGRLETSAAQQSEVTASQDTGMVQLASTATDTVANTGENINSVTAVAEKASASVVEITTEYLTTQPFIGQAIAEGGGSGVIYSEDGYIITNNHVVDGAHEITVTLSDGTEYPAALVGTDAKTDLAVVKIEAAGLVPVQFADSSALSVGELAVAIGNPLGELGGTVTNGIISATEREITIENENMTLIQTSAAVNPGNSGGGLFDANGNLIGIVNAKLSGSEIEGLAFAIPSNTVREIIAEIIENGYVTGRPQLGLQVLDISSQELAAMYRLNNTGLYVAVSNDALQLQAGDRIISIDGMEISSSNDANALLENYAVGDTLRVVVERNGQQLETTLPLTEQGTENVANVSNESVVTI